MREFLNGVYRTAQDMATDKQPDQSRAALHEGIKRDSDFILNTVMELYRVAEDMIDRLQIVDSQWSDSAIAEFELPGTDWM